MGVWGVYVDENDTYCEVQKVFFNKMKQGHSPVIIAHKIAEQYSQNPDINNVYFSLANCLWSCGINHDVIFDKVFSIIDNREDIKLWKVNGATEILLRQRAKELDKFKQKIQTICKNKTILLPMNKNKCYLHIGDIFTYQSLKKHYGGIVVDIQTVFDSNYYLIGISDVLSQKTANISVILNTPSYTAAWFSGSDILPANRLHIIGNVKIEECSFNGRAGFLFKHNNLDISNNGQYLTWQHKYRSLTLHNLCLSDFRYKNTFPKYYSYDQE